MVKRSGTRSPTPLEDEMWEASFRELSDVASRQLGLVTAAQVSRAGVEPAAVAQLQEAGLLRELDWEVFELAGARLDHTYAYPFAAWLAISPELFRWERPTKPAEDVVLSHESASELHGIGAITATTVVFSAPTLRTMPRATTIHVARLAPADVTTCSGVPVTTPHRTLLDLVRSTVAPSEVGRAVTDALRLDLVDLAALHADLAPLAAAHDFPPDGPEFLSYFTPDLRPETLSLRNLRAYASLSSPDEVTELSGRLREVIAASPYRSDEADRRNNEGALARDLAAEIVARRRWLSIA